MAFNAGMRGEEVIKRVITYHRCYLSMRDYYFFSYTILFSVTTYLNLNNYSKQLFTFIF